MIASYHFRTDVLIYLIFFYLKFSIKVFYNNDNYYVSFNALKKKKKKKRSSCQSQEILRICSWVQLEMVILDWV